MRNPARGPWLLPLAAALLTSACGDDGTEPVDVDYRPWETVSRMNDVVDPVVSSENALLGVSAAREALTQFSAEPTAALRPGGALGIRSRADALRSTRSGWSTRLTLPAGIVGETLVWDVDGQEYVVDETATDAPAGGVRVVYYVMNPFTGRPAEPLLALGYIDLTDEDIAGEERLGIRVVDTPESGPVVLLDYTVGFSGEPEQSSGNMTFTGVGAHTGVDLDLLQAFTWSEAEDSDVLVLDYQYAAGEGSVRLRMDASSAFDAAAWAEVLLRVDVSEGGVDVAVEVGIAPTGALDGEIRVGDVRVVDVHGVDGSPAFSGADGSALGPDDVEALRELWLLISNTLGVSNALMEPGALLLLPG